MDEHIATPNMDSTSQPSEPAKVEIEIKTAPSRVEEVAKEAVKETGDETPDVASLIPQDDYRTSPLFYELANYFNLDGSREMDAAKINIAQIIDWAVEETKSNNVEDILTAVRELEDKIERPRWGEKRYANLYRYLRLVNQRQAMDKAISAYERKS